MKSLAFALICCIYSSDAYSKGAPDTICPYFRPFHAEYEPQEFSGSISLMTEKAEEGVYVMLASAGENMFKGFLIQGRDASNGLPIGTLAEVKNASLFAHFTRPT